MEKLLFFAYYFLTNFLFLPRPTIDEPAGEAAWIEATVYDLPLGKSYFQNDDSYLYILIDLTRDTVDDPPLASEPWGDYFWFSFDVNENGVMDANNDILYSAYPGSYSLGIAYYVDSNGGTTTLNSSKSKLGAGFGDSSKFNDPTSNLGICIRS